jgi:hypothetical protein
VQLAAVRIRVIATKASIIMKPRCLRIVEFMRTPCESVLVATVRSNRDMRGFRLQ